MQSLFFPAMLAGGSYFGTPNYKSAADHYADQLGDISSSYNPYIKRGMGAQDMLGGLSLGQMAHPAALENRIAAGYEQSPYQTQALHNTTNMMNANAAMTGTLNSTAQQAALQQALAGQQNQFQQQYIDRATNQYNQGFGALGGLTQQMGAQGFQGTQAQNALMQEAALGRLKGSIAPSQFSNAFSSGLGALMGGF